MTGTVVSALGAAMLQTTFSVEEFGGAKGVLGDINGDGRPELLLQQDAGALGMLAEAARRDVDDRDRALHCLTAVSLDGRILWQNGEPWKDPDEPYTSHGGTGPVVDDVDGDGKAEVMMIRRGQLVVLDGASGRELRSVALPDDGILNVYTAQLGDPAQGKQIVCKATGRPYGAWTYGNPIVIFNGDLSVYKEPFAVRGAGHPCVARDIDGDGRDELFLGYSLLNHKGEELWRLDFGPGFDYNDDHADAIELTDLNGDGSLEILYAGSEDFHVVGLDGRILWTAHAGHSQASVTGPFGPGGEPGIVMSEKNRGVWGMDAKGTILWHRTDINGYAVGRVRWGEDAKKGWALFRPQLPPFGKDEVPFESRPEMCRELWPRLLDGDGTLLDVLPWKDEYAQPARRIRAQRSYDNGLLYNALVVDVDGDGWDEVVVFDRHRVWVFGRGKG